MTIQDAVAEVIYQDVRANPDKYPSPVVSIAQVVKDWSPTYRGRAGQKYSGSPSWASFKEALAEYGLFCTENE